jgi:hypothetical protein
MFNNTLSLLVLKTISWLSRALGGLGGGELTLSTCMFVCPSVSLISVCLTVKLVKKELLKSVANNLRKAILSSRHSVGKKNLLKNPE